MNKFIYSWLYLIGVLHILSGIVVSFFVCFDTNNSYINYLFNSLNIDIQLADSNTITLITTLLKLFGPAIIGWGILFLSLIFCLKTAFHAKKGFQFIKTTCILSTIVWYGLDSFIAWQVGFTFHVEFNVAIILLIVLPLIFLKPTAKE
ncbi:MAG: hypothetical protein K6L75_05515 [Cellvibrionaceae bacterium]